MSIEKNRPQPKRPNGQPNGPPNGQPNGPPNGQPKLSSTTEPRSFRPDPKAALLAPSPILRRPLLSNTLIVMMATVGSRGLGLLRDVIVAAAFGTQGDYNAYVAAFRIPDLLYLLIIGGALGSALIPVFSRFLGQGEEEKAWRLANAVINSALAAILVVSLLVFFITPQLVTTILAPGFKDQPDLLNKTINLTRLLLLQPILLGLGGIAMALLNGTNHFLWPALAPLFYNTCIILGIIFLSGGWGVYGMAVGVIIGAGVYLLVQIPALVRLGLRYQFTLDWRVPGLSEVFRVLGPRLIGQGVFQFNILITTNLASLISVSSVSGFNYAFQLFMLPHGIFALSVATVTFPAMARLYGAGNLDGLQATFARSLRQIIFFALPSTLGMALLARPVVMMIYQLGQFDNSSTELVSQTLAFFTFGLVAYGVVEIVTRAFYALQDTRSPVIIAVITVGLNIFLSAVLGREQTLATGGLALSLALATNFEMFALLWLLYRKMGTLSGTQERLLAPLLKITLAADIMAAVLWIGLHFLSPVLDETDKVGVILLTLGLIGLGAVTYAGTSLLLGVEELRSAFRRFRR